jgi:hypothetical protein
LFRFAHAFSSGDAAYCSGLKRKDFTTCSKELWVACWLPIRHGLVKNEWGFRFDILTPEIALR